MINSDKLNGVIEDVKIEIINYFNNSNKLLSYLRKGKQYKYGEIVEVKTRIRIRQNLIENWIKEGMNRTSSLTDLDIINDISNYSDYIEQLLLKGKNVNRRMDFIEIIGVEKSEGLLSNCNAILSINLDDKKKLTKEISNLKHRPDMGPYKKRADPVYVLMSNETIYTRQQVERFIKINDFIPLKDKEHICILEFDGITFPFKLLEYPLEIYPIYSRYNNFSNTFLLIWKGALKIENKEALRCIKVLR